MNHDLAVFRSIRINTKLETLWDILINPEQIKKYLFGTECISDWKEGSPIIFQGEYEGKAYQDKGTIRQLIDEELFEYSYWSSFSGLEDKPDNYSLVTFQIEKLNVQYLLQVTQRGYINEEAQEHGNSAWEEILKQIKMIAESD